MWAPPRSAATDEVQPHPHLWQARVLKARPRVPLSRRALHCPGFVIGEESELNVPIVFFIFCQFPEKPSVVSKCHCRAVRGNGYPQHSSRWQMYNIHLLPNGGGAWKAASTPGAVSPLSSMALTQGDTGGVSSPRGGSSSCCLRCQHEEQPRRRRKQDSWAQWPPGTRCRGCLRVSHV